MNAGVRLATTDLPRRAFTVREVERMAEAGILPDGGRVELIFGALIPMHPKGIRLETIKRSLLQRWYSLRPASHALLPETTLLLGADSYLEPDLIAFASTIRTADLNATVIDLAVKIADSSLGYDLGAEVQVDAHFGIRELWAIDAAGGRIHGHRDPQEGRYGSVVVHEAADRVTPAFASEGFGMSLSELDAEGG